MTSDMRPADNKTQYTPVESVPFEQEAGVLATLLLKQGVITEKQLAYALRIRKKIATPQTMLHTLIDLEYVDRN